MHITINGTLPGLNNYIDACRRNKYAAATMKKQSEQIICWAIKSHLGNLKIDGKVWVNFQWYEPNARRDPDNISSCGRKFIFDALVQTGVIKDDSQKYISGFTDQFFIDKKKPRVEVVIVKE